MKKKIVVSSYNDDLSFLNNSFLKDIEHVVYEKGKGDEAKSILLADHTLSMEDLVEKSGNTYYLPNVGVCSQTFLYHIVKNYDDLADINFFIAGDCLEDNKHRGKPSSYYYQKMLDVSDDSVPYINICETTGNYPLRSNNYRFFNKRMSEKWQELFNEPCPKKFCPAIDSTFMATKKAILSHPKSFYEKALSWIDERCYREDHWKMDYQGDIVSVVAPAKKNLKKFPHKSPKHFDFPACSFFEHSYQRMFDPDFANCVKVW